MCESVGLKVPLDGDAVEWYPPIFSLDMIGLDDDEVYNGVNDDGGTN